MKKLFTLAGAVALFAATIVPAVAVGNSCSNGTTGPFSENSCTVNNTSNVTVTNYNDAKITNNVTAVSNTGGNKASYNTLGGSISTGNASLNTTVSNVANINTTNITGGPAASGNTGSNSITGPGQSYYNPYTNQWVTEGTNDVMINNEQNVTVDNQNTAVVDNTVNATSNTGDNRAKYNTGPSIIETGDSWLGLSVGNHVNDNLTRISAGAGGTGGNTAGNSTTGPFSENSVTINNTADVGVTNYNDMLVSNDVDALSNSGRNKASYTTLGGDIETGNARAGVGVNTEGNLNETVVQMAMGGFANGGENGITGPESENNTYLNSEQRISVENLNNKCESHNAGSTVESLDKVDCKPWLLGVENFVEAESNVGDNWAKYNTGPSSIENALAELVQSVFTHINDSLTEISQ